MSASPPATARFGARLTLWLGQGVLCLYLGVICLGLILYFGADNTVTVPVSPRPVTQGVRNLAHLSSGARVTASSYYVFAHHHPIFAVDGARKPSHMEKWASHPDDRAPWIEVELNAPANIGLVNLALAGAHESPKATMSDFNITCYKGDARTLIHRQEVRKNASSRAHFNVACPGTDRVRVDFFITAKGTPQDVARLYEIELMAVDEEGT